MIQTINQLKIFFSRHKFPTQQQFWDWLDSYWHKDQNIPASSIDGLQEVVNGITDGIGAALDAKQDKEDSNLITNNTTVVGAINEVKEIAESCIEDTYSYGFDSLDGSIAINLFATNILEKPNGAKHINYLYDFRAAGIVPFVFKTTDGEIFRKDFFAIDKELSEIPLQE